MRVLKISVSSPIRHDPPAQNTPSHLLPACCIGESRKAVLSKTLIRKEMKIPTEGSAECSGDILRVPQAAAFTPFKTPDNTCFRGRTEFTKCAQAQNSFFQAVCPSEVICLYRVRRLATGKFPVRKLELPKRGVGDREKCLSLVRSDKPWARIPARHGRGCRLHVHLKTQRLGALWRQESPTEQNGAAQEFPKGLRI